MKVQRLMRALAPTIATFHAHACGSGSSCITGTSKAACDLVGYIGPFPFANIDFMRAWIVVHKGNRLTVQIGGHPEEPGDAS